METPFKAYDGNEPCIFVSYSHSDRDAVFKCLAHLHSRGFRIWYDEGIEPGSSWYEVLADRIASAACVLLFTLLHWPCSTTLLTVTKETGSWRWTLLAAALPTALGLGLCALLRIRPRAKGMMQ